MYNVKFFNTKTNCHFLPHKHDVYETGSSCHYSKDFKKRCYSTKQHDKTPFNRFICRFFKVTPFAE